MQIEKLPFPVLLHLVVGTAAIWMIGGAAGLFVPRGLLGPFLLPAGAACAVALYLTRLNFSRVVVREWPLFLFLCLAALSVTWSLDPKTTIVKVVLFASFVSVTLYGAVLMKPSALIRLLDVALTAAFSVSFAVALLIPSLGRSPSIAHHGDSWSGLFGHRSYFAALCAMSILLWLYRGYANPATWRFQLTRITFAAAGLYFANSKTSLLAAAFAVAAFVTIRIFQSGRIAGRLISRRLAVGLFATILLVTPIGLAVVAPMIPQLVGREDNLSGRTRFWEWGFELSAEHPLLGAGYRTFWIASDAATLVLQDRSWQYANVASRGAQLGNGHNGYFDTYFELGLVGVAVLAATIGLAIVRLGSLLWRGVSDPTLPLTASIIFYTLIDNLGETLFWSYEHLSNLMFMLAFLLLGKLAERSAEISPAQQGSDRRPQHVLQVSAK